MKKDFPVSGIRRFLEPGPIVLVSSAWNGKANIMTMGWHTVLEFQPSLVGCMLWDGNYSFELVRKSKECVINIPTVDLVKQVVGVGNCSGADVDKFARFKLTPVAAAEVAAPLIKECYANFECRIVDASMVAKYNFFVLEVVKAHVATRRRFRRPSTIEAMASSWSRGGRSACAGTSSRRIFSAADGSLAHSILQAIDIARRFRRDAPVPKVATDCIPIAC